MARVVSVEPAPQDAWTYRCDVADPVLVRFDFTPADPARSALAEAGWALTVSGGALPPRWWVESSGLAVGSEHPAVRVDATGSCPFPSSVRLSDVDYDAGVEACFPPPSQGTARIVSVEPAPEDAYRCPVADAVLVKFDLTLADPVQSVTTGWWLTLNGALPPRSWVESSGITVGSVHPATQRGPPPGGAYLDDVDYGAGEKACGIAR